MPSYEYVCPACRKEKEVRKPMSDASDPETCECGKVMHRRLSVVSVRGNHTPVFHGR